jgi:hypothetical protein
MSSLRRQEEALVALSYPQVAYRLEGGYGDVFGLGQMIGSIVGTGMKTVSDEKQMESRLTTEAAIRQAEIVADTALKNRMAINSAAMAPVKWSVVGLLGVGVLFGMLKATKAI